MKKSFKMENLGCANCAAKMEEKIKKLDGVNNATVNFMAQKLIIEADDENMQGILEEAAKICRKIEPDCIVRY